MGLVDVILKILCIPLITFTWAKYGPQATIGYYNFTQESKRNLVELGNPNTCAEVKLCLFLFTLTLKIVCSKNSLKFLKHLVLAKYE